MFDDTMPYLLIARCSKYFNAIMAIANCNFCIYVTIAAVL